MEEMKRKACIKRPNTAIFVAFGIGFLLHAAIILAGGIGGSHITEEGQKLNDRITQDGKDLRDRIAALEKVVLVVENSIMKSFIIYHVVPNLIFRIVLTKTTFTPTHWLNKATPFVQKAENLQLFLSYLYL